MCGITGFTGEDKEKIEALNKCIKYRGPDVDGVYVANGVSLGHVRLSIIDTSSLSNQPMKTEDGRYVITFNGEIYNFGELKSELINNEDYEFKTKGDTEVLLVGYQKWGRDIFEKLNGIFACAIYDTKEKELVVARDRSGIKPLYYYYSKSNKEFVFGSEIKALLEYGVKPSLNKKAFDAYMRLLFVPGEMSMISGINKLLPGHVGVFKDGKLEISRFYKEKSENLKSIKNKKKAESLVEKNIDEAVERQLISDKPIGIYLSGGIDSSVILDAVSKVKEKIKTFSIGFDLTEEEERSKFNKDFDLAEKTAQGYGTNHTGFLIKKDEVLPAFKKAIGHLGEPISNATIIPMFLLAERVKKQGIDVVLGGDGGDELFGGYERYRWAVRRSVYKKIPKGFRNIFNKIIPNLQKFEDKRPIDQYARFMFQKEKDIKEVMGSSYRDGNEFKKDFEDTYLEKEVDAKNSMEADQQTWLVEESLARSDRLSMAHGLEARVPFLDNKIIDLSKRIPIEFKVNIFNTKIILKDAFRNRLPDYLLNQPKRGWFSPGAKWLRYPEIEEFAKEVFKEGYHEPTDHLFDWEQINKMLVEHVQKRRYNFTMLWAILTFRVWAKEINLSTK